MSLIVEPWAFANYRDNFPTIPSFLNGTNVVPGTSNADGTPVTLLTTLDFDVHYLVVGLAGFFATSAAHYTLADILVDPAGGTAWRSFIDDLVCGFTRLPTSNVRVMLWYHFPVFIKAGNSIGCRARTSHTVASALSVAVIRVYGNPSRPDAWWCGSGVETLGVTAATSKGTSVTAGDTGAYGSWTTIGTSTARYGAVAWGFNGTDASSLGLQYFFQMGRNNVQIPGVPTMNVNIQAGETTTYAMCYGPNWCDIPSGTVFQIRGTCSGTNEVFAGGTAIYGVY